MHYTDIVIDNNSERFVERIMSENIWTKEYALRVIEEYKKFIYLGTLQAVAPSFEIDQVWHTHLLFTKDYKKMCNEVIGKHFDHNPTEAGKRIGKDPYITTKELYIKVFDSIPPLDIWTNWKKTHYAYIDLNTHWVIPVGDWKALLKILYKTLIN